MYGSRYTVQDLVDEVRSVSDELNTDSVDTENDILPALNRAQRFAFDIYSRRYPEPILKHIPLTFTQAVQEYDLPDDCFEGRILKMEIRVPSGASSTAGSTFREVQYISYSDLSEYESSSITNFPYYWTVIGSRIRVIPGPTATYEARLWYLREPDALVLPQGRITVVNTGSNYVVVDSAGSSLTTESDQLGSYVNVINGRTGEVRGSLQIASLGDNNRVTFRTTPVRDNVLGRDISSSMDDMDVGVDDYLATIEGTCIPYFASPTANFLVQFAVAEVVRKLGGQADTEEQILDKFEKQIERSYARRQQAWRVKKRSRIWGTPTRRLPWW